MNHDVSKMKTKMQFLIFRSLFKLFDENFKFCCIKIEMEKFALSSFNFCSLNLNLYKDYRSVKSRV